MIGTPTTIYLKVVNKQHEEVRTVEYAFNMEDKDGTLHRIIAVGLETITDEGGLCDLYSLSKMFPEVAPELLKRPTGPVDLLIGMDHRGIHPVEYVTRENLRVTRSMFGTVSF